MNDEIVSFNSIDWKLPERAKATQLTRLCPIKIFVSIFILLCIHTYIAHDPLNKNMYDHFFVTLTNSILRCHMALAKQKRVNCRTRRTN